MATRIISKTVTFTKSFTLGDYDKVLPPGDYVVDTEEDQIEGLSFDAYHRSSTIIYLPGAQKNTQLKNALTIRPEDLDTALLRDREGVEQVLEKENARPSSDSRAIHRAENEGMIDHADQPDRPI